MATQVERARCFERYVSAALRKPAVIGYHWFEHADQPAEGRFDGENSNFGTVTIEDNVYAGLTETIDSGQRGSRTSSCESGRPIRLTADAERRKPMLWLIFDCVKSSEQRFSAARQLFSLLRHPQPRSGPVDAS